MSPFDITPADIKGLEDRQLRNVLSLLLEAEAKKHSIPLSAIRLGGDQNAGDGGEDASVEWEGGPERTDWFPKRNISFQSKAEEMPRSKLISELAPKGIPRPFFGNLARASGAYIVFSTNDCSVGMYKDRISAMRDAVANVPLAERINFDFYDASRIARWVNCFPGVAIEARNEIGRPLTGWRPFENWSAPQFSTLHKYLIEDEPKATFGVGSSEPVSIVDAIDQVRDLLRKPGLAVRLIGVSGVGKTRFAQALFDDRIGQNALNDSLVVYGDLGSSPTTTASQIAEQLVHAQQEAVLIVDNCVGDTHRSLADIIQRQGSTVSLLTIDFDIGTDQPSNTRVALLHENGNSLIEALLVERVPNLSTLDRNRVVEFANGNARVALTIAFNAGDSGNLADLSDQQLINRLFLDDRRRTDDKLRRCAEVASLVYAFHVAPEKNQEPEHPILAALAEVSSNSMYRNIAEFVERGTAQKRGTQRAILPQAFAMQLASQALERLPSEVVLTHFNRQGQERLFRSFTRRLGHLHHSESARGIAAQLLAPNAMLGDPTTLNEPGIAYFENLAPLAPELVLAALERAIDGPSCEKFKSLQNGNRYRFAMLARHLAYDQKLFERAAGVLLAFAKEEPEGHNNNAVNPQFLELFWIGLSWTQTPPEQRYAFIDRLMARGDAKEKRFALLALDHALTTGSRSSSYDGRFGSQPRGKEWRPKSREEQDNWFREALTRLVPIACRNDELASLARSAIAQEFRGLIRTGLIDDLVEAVNVIRANKFWAKGWKDICGALHFDRDGWPPETLAKVDQLEQVLRPESIEDRFSAYAMGEPWGLYHPASEVGDGVELGVSSLAEQVGEQAAKMPDFWPSMVHQCCAFVGSSSCLSFGRGLANGANDICAMWRQLVLIFREQKPENRNAAALSGFLATASATAPDEVQSWLDEAVTDDTLGKHIVELSIALPIDRRSINRLIGAVRAGKAPLQTYRWLRGGRATKPTPPEDLVKFLRVLSATGSDGAIIAADIFRMYLFGQQTDSDLRPELTAFGRKLLLSSHLYQNTPRSEAYYLVEIAKKCLDGEENEQTVRDV